MNESILARPNQSLVEHLTNVGNLCYNYGSKYNLGYTAKLIGLCHDLGKININWQKYLNDSINNKSVDKVNHSKDGAFIFIILAEKYNLNPKFIIPFANIISSHHGNLHDDLFRKKDGNWELFMNNISADWFTNNYDLRIIEKEINNIIKSVNKELADFISNHEINAIRGYYPYSFLTKILYSILIDSDRSDAGKFCKNDNLSKNTIFDKFIKYMSKFSNNTKINVVRNKILNQCLNKGSSLEPGHVYGISTPTGSGKTFSSHGFSLSHILNRDMDRVIYVVPFLSILDQTEKSLKMIYGDDDIMVEDYSSSDVKKTLYTENWDKPIILTTMVNFMGMLMSSSGSELRKLHNVGNSCIIFDEIQQLPTNCIANFNECLNELTTTYNTTVLLSTATTPTLDDNKFNHHINMTEKNIVSLSVEEKALFEDRCQYVNMSDNSMDMFEIANFVENQMNEINSFLIVVNTKRESTSLYDILSEKFDYCELLNTNLTKKDRNNIIDRITLKTKSNEKVICISTNLIEAGVDLSFDRGIRFCGGEDNIVQTAGRINRHGNNIQGKIFIIKLKDEGSGRNNEFKILGSIENSKISFLDNMRYNNYPIGSDNSLLNYYDKYYFGIGSNTKKSKDTNSESEYEIDDTTAYQLLGNLKKEYRDIKKTKNINKYEIPYSFQYNMVSENFKMIADSFSVFICNSEELHKTWDKYCEINKIFEEYKYLDIDKTKSLYRELSRIMKIIHNNSVSVLCNDNNENSLNQICDNKYGLYVDFDNKNYDEKRGFEFN